MYNTDMTTAAADPRYPVGRFAPILPATDDVRRGAIDEIAALPSRLREAIDGLTDTQLDTPYRQGGWTVRQVVHHVADSHANAYIRVKLALAEDTPTIKPYDENAWASMPDSRLPIAPSLAIIDGLHTRWTAVMRAMHSAQFARMLRHPEYPDGPLTLDRIVQMYAWHSRHHVAHITALRAREGW